MDLEQRIRMAAESILENEALRQGMEADGADIFLNWGIQCAKEIAAATANIEDDIDAEDAMDARMRSLRRMLEAIQELYAPEADAERQATAWEGIVHHAPIVYDRQPAGLETIQPGFAALMRSFSGEEKYRMLRALIENNLSERSEHVTNE